LDAAEKSSVLLLKTIALTSWFSPGEHVIDVTRVLVSSENCTTMPGVV
jgi:hypothetical protein